MADVNEFLRAAVIPRDRSHSAGDLAAADAMLAADPSLAHANIFTAAVRGDHAMLRRFIDADPDAALSRGGPYGWDVLTHTCFSRYLQQRHDLNDGFIACVRSLLDAGASPNTGFFEDEHAPRPEWESVLYGAAGVAHNPGVTQLLVDAGADVNDGEVPYHAPESYDNRALEVIVNSGRVNQNSLQLMLVRKFDWHDHDGARWLLEHGADANAPWGSFPPFHFAITRDNGIDTFELLLDKGADPYAVGTIRTPHAEERTISGVDLAARCGRADILTLMRRRGMSIALTGVAGVIEACVLGHTPHARAMLDADPSLLRALNAEAGVLMMRFALTGNNAGITSLLDVGADVNARTAYGDGYWDMAKNGTALHAAAWRAHHDVVKTLIARGADANARDARDRTPLMFAVRAATDSYWMKRRSTASIEALLAAGAATDGITIPTGYAEADVLLGQSR